jgi:aminocarboxymuconate-semialdehyde decarboxylase
MDELGLQGVQIGSHLNGPGGVHWNLDAPELFEFFEAAELGDPVELFL